MNSERGTRGHGSRVDDHGTHAEEQRSDDTSASCSEDDSLTVTDRATRSWILC